jgi:hypothetical protein
MTAPDRAREIAERVVRYTRPSAGLGGATSIHWEKHDAVTIVPEPYASSVYEAAQHAIIAACHEYAAPIERERDEAVAAVTQTRKFLAATDNACAALASQLNASERKLARVEAMCTNVNAHPEEWVNPVKWCGAHEIITEILAIIGDKPKDNPG